MSEDANRKVVDDMVDATHDPTSLNAEDGVPTVDAVVHRADARPPEESSSDDPRAQAAAILEESELRVEERADQADA